jgi:hypothetical protein
MIQGDTHFELFSPNHVWAIIATPSKPFLPTTSTSKQQNSSLFMNKSQETSLTGFPPIVPGSSSVGGGNSITKPGTTENVESNQMVFLLRPSKAYCQQKQSAFSRKEQEREATTGNSGSKDPTKCLSVLWSPGTSVSVSTVLYSKLPPAGSSSSRRTTAASTAAQLREKRIKPAIHIQLFEKRGERDVYRELGDLTVGSMGGGGGGVTGLGDSSMRGGESQEEMLLNSYNVYSHNNAEMEEKELGKLTRKPLRTTRALSKFHK